MIPTYESNATPEEKKRKLELMIEQVKLLHEQEKIATPVMHTKIRCGCRKLIVWWAMYRCLYCGVWYCKDCAEQHFGAKAPEPFEGVLRS